MAELLRIVPAMRTEATAVQVARLAHRQWGVVARWQLLAFGISASAVTRWLAAGYLHPLYPGVYAVGHLSLSENSHLVAALFHAGRGAALSHASGARWWEVTKFRPEQIQISVPTRRVVSDKLTVFHPRHLERVFHNGLPVTPLARTLLDLAAVAPERELRRALAEADYRHGLDPAELRPFLGRGARGSAALRSAIESHLPELARTLSPFEDDFLFFCERHDLPQPLVNRRIAGKRVDGFWPKQRLIVELDSVSAHGSRARRLIDRERDLHLRRLGYTVLRYTWHQLHATPEDVAADLRGALFDAN